jgi:hypothetical protein
VNVKQHEETARAPVSSDEGLLAIDENKTQDNAPSSITEKPPVSKRKLAVSLSDFLKKQRYILALRRQDDRKQA